MNERSAKPRGETGKKPDPLNNPSFYQDHINLITKLQALYRGHSVRSKLKKLKELVEVFESQG